MKTKWKDNGWRSEAMKAKPQHAIIDVLREFLRLSGLAGIALPAVNPGNADEIVLEWWRGDRSLTLFVTKRRVRYLKAWGKDGRMMNDGIVGQPRGKFMPTATFETLWRWLIEGVMV